MTLSRKSGIHAITPAEYHQDPSDEPSLSAHIAHVLLTRSPLHAWTASPRLNPNYERTERATFDLGTAVHDLWLRGKQDTVVIVEANDWRTKAAQEQRDAAYLAGRTPLLAKDWQRVREMCQAIEDQLAEREDNPPLFAKGGQAEQTIIWRERGVTCRALVDWLHIANGTVCDLKTTSASANPHAWCRTTMWNIGADIQLAMHSRGVQAVTGKPVLMRYCVVETTPPYALSVVTLAPPALELANAKVDRAMDTWRECLATNTWPAYTRELCHAEPPPWEEARFLEEQAIKGLAA